MLGLHERRVSVGGVESEVVDLEAIGGLAATLGALRASIVVHTSGLTSAESCEMDPELAWHVNVRLAVNVASACSIVGIPMVHISTDHLFQGQSPLLDEVHPVDPMNVYGHTKAEAEKQVLDANPEALVVRTNFYGWGPSYRPSFSDFIIQGVREGRELTLFEDVTYTPILIEAVVGIVHELVGLNARGVFNVVGDDRVSKYEFGLRVADEFGLDREKLKPGLLAEQTRLVQRPRDMSLSNLKATQTLGRPLGGVFQHLTRLRHQEESGVSLEIGVL